MDVVQRITVRQLLIGGIAVIVASLLTTVLVIVFGDDDPRDTPNSVPATEVESTRESALARTQPGERWIAVDRSTAEVTLYIGTEPQVVYQARLGEDPSADGFYATAIGTFHVYSLNADLAPTSFYEGGYLTEWVGFDPDRFNGFHSPVRDANGEPFPVQNDFTKGCVRLKEDDARAVFAFAELGMRIEVHD